MLPPEISLPSSATIFTADHPKNPKTDDEIRDILNNDSLRQIISQSSIIVVNDHHRSTPSGRILEIIADLYVDVAKVDYIVIATGTHEEPTDKQLSEITHRVEERFDCEILIHDSTGKDVNLVEIGETTRGTRVLIHPVILDYDNIICINSVEPHYFAGFTGGIKSIFPGLAAKSSVEQNHSWALDDLSQPTNILDNPLQLDLWETYEMINKKVWGIQMVNFQRDIFFIDFGELKETFTKTAKESLKIYSQSSKEKFDVIVSVVYPPLDRSLYQAQKGIENTRQILKSGGEMYLLARCQDGIGSNAFYETMKQFNTPDEVLMSINRENYKFGDHKAYKFASLAKESKITLVGDLNLDQGKRVFANVIKVDDLEFHLSRFASDGKSIAIVVDSGSLSLFLL